MAESRKKRSYPKPKPKRTFGDGEVKVHVRLRTDTIGYQVPTVSLERHWTTEHGKPLHAAPTSGHTKEVKRPASSAQQG